MIRKLILLLLMALTEIAIYSASAAISGRIDPTYTDSLAFMDMLDPILRLIVVIIGVLGSYLTVLIIIHGLTLIFPPRGSKGAF